MEDQKDLLSLLPNIAAQLRVYLSNLRLASQRLAAKSQRESDPDLDARAAALDQSFYQMLRILDDLDDVGYLTGQIPLVLRDCDIVDLVGELCGKAGDLAETMGLTLKFFCPKGYHICSLDRRAMEKLVNHLLSNAMKFTPPGGVITVELRISGGQLLLSVADTGRGISEELLPTLFDRYLHTDRMDPAPHGLGLGLPLCRCIAEGHGGTLLAESLPGKGSRFILSLPDRRNGVPHVSDVPFDPAGGLNLTLRALADALPVEAFLLRSEE